MPDLKAIRGNKPKAMAQGHFLECRCTPVVNRTLVPARTGVVKGANGKVIHRGTPVWLCPICNKVVE